MQFWIEGVDRETGNAVPRMEVEAADPRQAVQLAAKRGIKVTKVTPDAPAGGGGSDGPVPYPPFSAPPSRKDAKPVYLVDLDIPFWSLVRLQFKWVFATLVVAVALSVPLVMLYAFFIALVAMNR